jgi:2-methylisocitrate lyase-like PEP mutase family enzyme
MHGDFGLGVADLAALGTRRISVGGALARVAWSAFIQAADQIAKQGSFASFAGNAPSRPLTAFFGADRKTW